MKRILNRTFTRKIIHFCLILILLITIRDLFTATKATVDPNWRTFGIMDANQIGLRVSNFGTFAHPVNTPAFEWPRNSQIHYGMRFGLVLGGKVFTDRGAEVKIVTHALDMDEGNADNTKWWEPIAGYSVDYRDPTVEKQKGLLALNTLPKTWGEKFPKNEFNEKIWPGQFSAGKFTADLEFYYKMSDQNNNKNTEGNLSLYNPDTTNFNNRGLGLEVTGRGYEFVARVSEDMIFLIYEITNVGNRALPELVSGLYGEPQIGGRNDGNPDQWVLNDADDYVYFWDEQSGNLNNQMQPIGYMGFSFLETPGNANDGLDNDGDNLVDESQSNQIDDDQDWQATDAEAEADLRDFDKRSDDIGVDGLADTGDAGEGNGVADEGEPDFEKNDLDEVDQLGLTGLTIRTVNQNFREDRNEMWQALIPGTSNTSTASGNLAFLMSVGYFPLAAAETQKFALLTFFSDSLQQISERAKIAQDIYHFNFNFQKAPDLPIVTAEAGDKSVKLFWDNRAEKSFDPILGNDFEGYAIYRSTDGKNWGTPINNARGKLIYSTPIAKFDSLNQNQGFHAIDVDGVRFYLGNNSGLRHSYIDQNLMNGVTYYYAVTAYDFGSEEQGIAPLECSKTLGNPNVVMVTPRSSLASTLDEIIAVPNPYIASSVFDQSASSTGSGLGGGRRIIFMNLPENCTIRIFTVTGEQVRQLDHTGPGGDAIWDLQNQTGLEVASGTYIYHIDAQFGKKIGRLAIIK
ncbi:hypothetical protein JW964_26470 [candidate division KSB1 bacterium]|nr:hypothetical protein [candidate division KSB1 bacterium]